METREEQQQCPGPAKENNVSASKNHFYQIAEDSSFDDTEGLARVVAVDDRQIWLEPMQAGSCGGCASAAACGSKGIGTIANRLAARRFPVRSQLRLQFGEQVVVAFDDKNLVKAAAVAYVIPLLFALAAAIVVQAQAGRDGLTLLAAVAGLAAGLTVMKLVATRLEARGNFQARIVRRHGQAIHIFPSGA
jgi:sigma-E factor negative regulatory protein RseC